MAGALRIVLRVALVLAAAALAALAAAAPFLSGGAASGSQPGLTRIGRAPSLPSGASILGPPSPATRLRVTVTLNPRDPAALTAYAQAVATPGSGAYRDYLTPSEFARRFGATAAQTEAVRASLRAHGLNPGPVSANALSIPVSATVGALARAFSLSFRHLALPGPGTAIAATAAPAIDAGVAPDVQAVLGLDTLSAPHPLMLRSTRDAASLGRPRARAVTGGPQPCPAARQAAPGQSAYTSDQIASAYGLPGLYGAGDDGAGVTVAVYELEPDDPNDIAAYQTCYGTHAAVSYVQVDGGAGSGAGSGEAALDIENVIGLVPGARVIVYQGPDSNSGGPGSGPYDVFSSIVNDDLAQVVTVSWGQCEALQGSAAAAAENTLFQQASVQGQSIVAATGDQGSEDCNGSNRLPNLSLAVDDPASQPFVTGVGGTTLTAIGPRPTETTWNNNRGVSILGGLLEPGAGGGGISSFWPMPADQRGSPPSLHVVQADSSGASCGNGGGYCRQAPDVSADADPTTGYLIYWNGTGGVTGAPSGWQGIGGTSGAAPMWAALIALADASRACGGSPIGFANPALYRAAATAYAGDFNDVRTGNNDFTRTNGGQFGAGTGYDMATGLGTPNGAALAADLCADRARIANPGPQRSTAQASVSLQLKGGDARGERLGYGAAGLPPGLSLNAATGRIAGKPRRTGTFTVTVTARDVQGSSANVTFGWTVGARPTVSKASLVGLRRGRPALSFTITAGRRAPALRTVLVSVPPSLRFSTPHGGAVTGQGGTRLRFAAHLAHGSLTITLRHAASTVRVTIAYPSLRSRAASTARARHERPARALTVDIGVIDADDGALRLAVKVRPSG